MEGKIPSTSGILLLLQAATEVDMALPNNLKAMASSRATGAVVTVSSPHTAVAMASSSSSLATVVCKLLFSECDRHNMDKMIDL